MKLFANIPVSALCLCGVLHLTASAEEKPAAPTEVSYFKQVLPILRAKNCTGCHQPAKRGGDYVMTDFAALLKGGETGEAAVVPGDAAKSQLLAQITPKDGKAAMPKDAPPLTDAEVALVKTWIEQGAKNDTPTSNMLRYDADHPPEYLAPPVLKAVKFSPSGDALAIAGYHEVLLHKPDGSGLIARLVGESERIEAIAFSPDGTMLAACGGSPGRFGEVQIWDIAKRELKLSKMVGYDTIYGVSWSPNGKLVGFGCPDNTMRGIDPTTGEQLLFNGAHSDWVLDTVFSTASDHIITVSRDMSMKLVEVGTQRFVDNLTSITPGALKGGLIAIDRHPTKDELLCGGSDGAPKIFKMIRTEARKIGDNANLLKEFPAQPGRIFGVAYSKDGAKMAAGSSQDGRGEVRVYDTTSFQPLWKLEVPEGGVYSVDFRPNGQTLAVAGFDGEVRLVNVADGKLLSKFLPIEIKTVTAAK
ncbi:WD40 repeat domain-containing protein [Anatilimnocola sp. NA78]|uniref:WD40 repeat domain-containing protein n=1 Tax=Anatilimnocola sp. NA78 TaxID=3415683 RepID=UPI003CE5028D